MLYVEATDMEGPEGLTITGQLGDVMKESAEIALSYVRSHATELGIDPERLRGRRFHVHVPAGAVPKDGPSAGVTLTTALVSLLRDVPVRSVVGMTGEVTLQGRVLPIGGVKQKVLAAHRAGLEEVVLPQRNGGDLEDVPEAVREAMTFHLAERGVRRAVGGVRRRRRGGPGRAGLGRRRLDEGPASRLRGPVQESLRRLTRLIQPSGMPAGSESSEGSEESPAIWRCSQCGMLVHPSDERSPAAWCARCQRVAEARRDGG